MRNLKRVLALAMAMVMILGMMVIGSSAASIDFDDVAEINYTEAVDVLTGLGVLNGTGDGSTFSPDDILTREQAAKIMCYIMMGEKNAEKLPKNQSIFNDVAAGRWSAGYISYCANVGVIDGYGNGDFGPTDTLTGVQFAKLLLTAAGYDADAEGYTGDNWAENIATAAIANGLDLTGVALAAPLTREQAAQMVLQALEMSTVDYLKGTVIGLVGAYTVKSDNTVDYNGKADGVQQFCEKYYPKLEKTAGYADNWGRPADHAWEEDANVYANILKNPVASYNTAVTECDIAAELGLKKNDGDVSKVTVNGKAANVAAFTNDDSKITRLATWKTIGEQGRLTEIYKVGTTYQIVMIDQFLAKVTDVTEVEYDRNGHISKQAKLKLTVYDEADTTAIEYSNTNWEYKKGDMLLIYAETINTNSATVVDTDTADQYIEFVGYAESMTGAQTAYTTDPVHIVGGTEYPDAIQFNENQAIYDEISDHVWYFDTYHNLIAAFDIADKYSYGTISSIYWKDSNNGENGYALATITYMDGTTETAKVAKIGTKTLAGVEGTGANYALGLVSSTRQYNESYTSTVGNGVTIVKNERDYTNVAMYEIKSTAAGLVLTETTLLAGAKTETGVPAMTSTMNAGDTTLFLVWNGKSYETYTGIDNVPSYQADGEIWVKDIRNDKVAEYVFINNASTADSVKEVTYFWNTSLTVTNMLYNYKDGTEYYIVDGGYVNGVKEPIQIKASDAAVLSKITSFASSQDRLMMLTVTNGYVTAADYVTTEDEIGHTKTYAIYAGAAKYATLADGVLITADGSAYKVAGHSCITYNYNLDDTIEYDDAAYLYIVYAKNPATTVDKTAQVIYITDVPYEGALAAAKTEAAATLKSFIVATVDAADATDSIDLTKVVTDNSIQLNLFSGGKHDTMYEAINEWVGELNGKTTVEAVNGHLATLISSVAKQAAEAYAAKAVDTSKIYNEAGLKAFAAQAEALMAGESLSVTLMADITLTEAWDPIALVWNPENPVSITINGNGKTISGLTVSGGNDIGFFGGQPCAIITISDLTFKNASVTTTGARAGVIMGGQYGKLTLSNVDVKNSTVQSTAPNANGSFGIRLGALVGISFTGARDRGEIYLTNCDSVNNTIVGYHNIGGLVGTINDAANSTERWEMTNCTSVNNYLEGAAKNALAASAFACDSYSAVVGTGGTASGNVIVTGA